VKGIAARGRNAKVTKSKTISLEVTSGSARSAYALPNGFLSNRAERGTKLADGIKLVSLTTHSRDSANSKGIYLLSCPVVSTDFPRLVPHKLSVLGSQAVQSRTQPKNQNVSR